MDTDITYQLYQRALRFPLENISKYEDNLFSLTSLDFLASRYDLGDLISKFWEEHLQPDNCREVFELICSIARGYQTNCQFLLPFFQYRIEDEVSKYLNEVDEPRTRMVLSGALARCQDEISRDLHSENYYDQKAEEALEYPYDPDFDSESYYEHEDRLQIDDGYREMWRRNMQIRDELAERCHASTQASWEDLFQKAVEFVQQGPRRGFRFDLVD
ncbi:hypothetical protein BDV32DRAFT_128488 [Aspergillus pseudonomiae]|nr:hypothetical protein BDV32DRAFT_128488 [Aspergillus pseudonomiae]